MKKIDENEYLAARREIYEELELDLNQFEVEKVGSFQTDSGNVAVFIAKCDTKNSELLPIGEIKGEGKGANWYDYTFILNNSHQFPNGYIDLYKHLCSGKKGFKLGFRKSD